MGYKEWIVVGLFIIAFVIMFFMKKYILMFTIFGKASFGLLVVGVLIGTYVYLQNKSGGN